MNHLVVVAGNGLLDVAPFSAAAPPSPRCDGYTVARSRQAEPLKDDPWSLGMAL